MKAIRDQRNSRKALMSERRSCQNEKENKVKHHNKLIKNQAKERNVTSNNRTGASYNLT